MGLRFCGFVGWAIVVNKLSLLSTGSAFYACAAFASTQPAMHALLATHASSHTCIDLLACMRAGTHTSIHDWLSSYAGTPLPSLATPSRIDPRLARFSRSATHRFTHARRHAYSIHLPRHLTRRVKHRFTHARRYADSIHLPRRFACRVTHSRIDSRIDAVCKRGQKPRLDTNRHHGSIQCEKRRFCVPPLFLSPAI